MSDLELNRRLAAVGSTKPVIFVTAHDEPDTRKQALEDGCVAFLQKTDSGEKVLAAIAQAAGTGTSRTG